MDRTDKGTDTPERRIRPAGILTLGIFLLILVTGFLLSWHSLTDIDIWFHLRSGQDLLAGEGLPGINKYSFTEPEHPWLNHEWLFQVVVAALGPRAESDPLGVTAWNVLRATLSLTLILALCWAGGLWRRSGWAAAWTGVVILFSLLLLWPRLTLRPELISYTFFIILVPLAERVGQETANRPSAPWKGLVRGPAGGALLVTLTWAQCHGFAALAPVVLILAALLAPLETRWRGPRPPGGPSSGLRWLLVAAALLALAATPNGLEGLLFPLRALGQFTDTGVDLRRTVSELVPLLQSPSSLDWTIKAYLVSLIGGAVWIFARWRDLSLLRIVLFVMAAAAAWTSQRNIGLYALSFVLLLGSSGSRTSWLLRRLGFKTIPGRAPVLVGLAVLTGACLLWWPSIMSDDFYLHEGVGRRFGGGTNPARFPVAPVAGLDRSDRFFANLDAAAFTLAQAPGRIFIDGRTEAYSPALWGEYLKIKRGGDEALALLARHRVDAVCLATSNPAFRSLTQTLWNSRAWRLARADGAGLLFVPEPGNGVALSDTTIARVAMTETAQMASGGPATRRADFLLAAARLAGLAGEQRLGHEFLVRGLEFQPGHPALHHNLGNILMAREMFAEAADHFETALDLNPRLGGSALNAGVCQSRLGDRETARRFFRRAVRIDPRHFEAWMNLAVTEAALNDRQAAVRAAERARKLRPHNKAVRELQQRLGS